MPKADISAFIDSLCSAKSRFFGFVIFGSVVNGITKAMTSQSIDGVFMMAAEAPWFRVYIPEPIQQHNVHGDVPGVKNMPPRNSLPIAYFYLMFSINILKKITRETNRYAKQLLTRKRRNNTLHASSRLRMFEWNGKFTVTEIKGFSATIFNMGLIRKPSIKDYWSKKFKSQKTPWFSGMFSRNRFQLLLRCLHLVNNKNTPQRNSEFYDPSAWFKPIVEHANMVFKRYLTPKRELSIDESLIGTKARTIMTQYIPSKSSKFGIKLWMLVEASTGYIIHFLPYRGKRYDPIPNNETQGCHVVFKLLRSAGLLGKWFHVFCDNFFTSISLASRLYTENTYLTDTIRKNRHLPRLIKEANPNANQSVFARRGPLLCCAFRERPNRKVVRFVSTYHNGIHNQNEKPSLAISYNQYMGGVDLNDMMCGIYEDKRKTKTMWKRVAINIFHRMLLNAYILYKYNTDENQQISRYEFIVCIIESLATEHRQHRDRGGVERNVDAMPHVTLQRLPGKREKNCVVCSTAISRKRSKTVCLRCGKGVHGLCVHRHRCEIEL
ncbi:piggyBac transposable element-derived protein 4-like [Mytilus edulis]|uniref:piggyBac transposable element-derived protein 4-like n=1 Tax=Mytilus edulis TaxID=6550 RepID=UPI0039F04BF0